MEKREDNKNRNNQKAQSNKETKKQTGLQKSWAFLSDSHSETGRMSGGLGQAPRLLTQQHLVAANTAMRLSKNNLLGDITKRHLREWLRSGTQ